MDPIVLTSAEINTPLSQKQPEPIERKEIDYIYVSC